MQPIKHTFKKGEIIEWSDSVGESINLIQIKPPDEKYICHKDGDHFICTCKQTGNPPYCDGTHTKL